MKAMTPRPALRRWRDTLETAACSRRRTHRTARRLRVQDGAAADRDRRRIGPQDEPVAAGQDGGFLEPDPDVARSRRERDASEQFAGALMEPDPCAVFQRRASGEHFTWRSARRVGSNAGRAQHVAARKVRNLHPARLTAVR